MAQTGGYGGTTHLRSGGTGSNADVDTASEALTSSTEAVAVNLKADDDNSGKVHYQVDGTDATTADFELGAGDMSGLFPVPGNDLTNITMIGSAANQIIYFHYLV